MQVYGDGPANKKTLCDVSKGMEPMLGFVSSQPEPTGFGDGGRKKARYELVTHWQTELPKFEAARESHPALSPKLWHFGRRLRTLYLMGHAISITYSRPRGTQDAAYQANFTTQKTIPVEHLTRVVSKAVAAPLHAMRKVTNPTKYFDELIRRGVVTQPIGGGQNWQFDIREFPESSATNFVSPNEN